MKTFTTLLALLACAPVLADGLPPVPAPGTPARAKLCADLEGAAHDVAAHLVEKYHSGTPPTKEGAFARLDHGRAVVMAEKALGCPLK
jgi:hypothetical protein